MKVLCCGSRTYSDRVMIRHHLSKLPPKTIIVHGGNGKWNTHGELIAGADEICGEIALKLGFEVRKYKAQWTLYGPSAGPIRNAEILAKEHPDKNGVPFQFVLAFANRFSKTETPGTYHMVGLCEKAKIPVTMVGE